MSEIDHNKALVRGIYEEMWNQHNPTAAQAIFARPTGVERAMREFLSAFPDLQHTGQWKNFAPTGKFITYTGVTLARIAYGKIVDHSTWWDRIGLVEQIEDKSE